MIPQGLSFALIHYFVKCKHVLTIHAAGLFLLKRMKLGKIIAKYIIDNTNVCLPVSKYNHICLTKLTGKKIRNEIISMGVNTSMFSSVNNKVPLRKKYNIEAKNVLLYVGKLTPKKGIIYLIWAFEKVIRAKKDTVLILIGSGYIEQELKAKVAEMGLEGHVIFPGPQKHDILKEYYQLSDIVVIPSIIDEYGETEGVPVVLLESLDSGKPVIATDVGGISDVIKNGYNGLIVRQKDLQSLFEKIVYLLENNKVKVMGDNALKTGGKYDWSIIGKQYAKQFDDLF